MTLKAKQPKFCLYGPTPYTYMPKCPECSENRVFKNKVSKELDEIFYICGCTFSYVWFTEQELTRAGQVR